MISICIPTYNTDCTRLLEALQKQIGKFNEEVDVLVLEDGSKRFVQENADCCKQHGFIYISNGKNMGRVASRVKLAKTSKNHWIVFLDADMLPVTEKFTFNYYNAAAMESHDVFIGGHCYEKKPNIFNLRLRYGKAREETTSDKRNTHPYNNIFFGNMMIKKDVFLSIFSNYTNPVYGEDLFLSAMLKARKIKVLHIDNYSFHLGLEKNHQFLKKIEEAASTVARLYNNEEINLEHSKLIRYYVFFQRYHLKKTIYFTLAILIPAIKKNLIWLGGPLLFIDAYRFYHLLKNIKNEG